MKSHYLLPQLSRHARPPCPAAWRHVPSTRSCRCRSVTSDKALETAKAYQEQATSRPHRFYVPQSLQGASAKDIVLDGDEGRHAVRALRLREGDAVELCDGRGGVLRAEITSLDKGSNRAWVQGMGEPVVQAWRGPRWVLAAACTTLKGGRTEWLVEKAAELGAAELVPLTTARSSPLGGAASSKYKGKKSAGGDSSNSGGDDYQPGRLERVATAAMKQSLRTHGLQLASPTRLEKFLPRIRAARVALVAAAGGAPVASVLQEQLGRRHVQDGPGTSDLAAASGSAEEHILLVGPEGDWTAEELDALHEAGALPVGLGENRLRAETAAIAMLSVALLWHGALD